MDLRDILQLDFAYLETFTNRKDTAWGTLFCNEEQPNYYDANHAHIHECCNNPELVMNEVVSYYKSKGIIPRFYMYNIDQQQELISYLIENHFDFEELVAPVQLWNDEISNIEKNKLVTIEVVTKQNYDEALKIECSIKEFGSKDVREKAFAQEFHHSQFTHYLLRYNGIACATACIFIHENQARMESVATLEEFRGRGLIGELIQHIQREVVHKDLHKLWVFPINEKIEKVYRKYGFNTVAKLQTGHAFLGGRSIKEIQES
ncbi:GNAT family N-acetyltransferase [Bacillus sp. JJ722]|uniref:GNAT family N-acetyltransferase n=1 Tax=Bacillus sp. JJ722 TaxID=3122973 RepID=UPI002FFEDCC7